MNDPQKSKQITGETVSPVPAIQPYLPPSSNPPIVPTEPISTVAFVEDSDFVKRAKAFESATGSLVSLVDSACNKVLLRKATAIVQDEDEAEEMVEPARLSKESKDSAKQALARIVARRFKDSEAVDIAVLSGVAVELAAGFKTCLNKLNKLEQKMLAAEKKAIKTAGAK